MRRRRRLAATVGAQHHIGIQHCKQPLQVRALAGRQERAGNPLTLGGIGFKAGPALPHMPASAACQLTHRRGAALHHRSDLRVLQREGLPQHKHYPLQWAQCLQHHQHRGRHRLRQCHLVLGLWLGEHRLRQPLADIDLASRPSRPQVIKAQPAHHRGQPRPRILNLLAAIQAQERLLHHLLGLEHTAKHPIGQPHQPVPFGIPHPRLLPPRTRGRQHSPATVVVGFHAGAGVVEHDSLPPFCATGDRSIAIAELLGLPPVLDAHLTLVADRMLAEPPPQANHTNKRAIW
jgi:hypothetical protein